MSDRKPILGDIDWLRAMSVQTRTKDAVNEVDFELHRLWAIEDDTKRLTAECDWLARFAAGYLSTEESALVNDYFVDDAYPLDALLDYAESAVAKKEMNDEA